jgi:hypothetical protein
MAGFEQAATDLVTKQSSHHFEITLDHLETAVRITV